MNNDKFNKMVEEDYPIYEERLRVWVEAVEEELQAAKYFDEKVYVLLRWTVNEYFLRRSYLSPERTPLEDRARKILNEMERRMEKRRAESGIEGYGKRWWKL